MDKIYCTLLFAACFCILIDCQGGGGGGGGGSGSSSSSRSRSSSRYGSRGGSTDIYSFLGGIGICIVIGFSIYLCYCCCQGQRRRDNQTFVNLNSERRKQKAHQTNRNEQMQSLNSNHCNVFRSGIWASCFYQYKKWHGPFEGLLSFDPQTMQVTGSGWDNVGNFTVFGYYSNETRRMGLTKRYQGGTGDSQENLGHEVVIQVTENSTNVFKGKWYVKTSKYHGEDSFQMKFIREREFEAETATTSCSITAENTEINLDKSSHLF